MVSQTISTNNINCDNQKEMTAFNGIPVAEAEIVEASSSAGNSKLTKLFYILGITTLCFFAIWVFLSGFWAIWISVMGPSRFLWWWFFNLYFVLKELAVVACLVTKRKIFLRCFCASVVCLIISSMADLGALIWVTVLIIRVNADWFLAMSDVFCAVCVLVTITFTIVSIWEAVRSVKARKTKEPKNWDHFGMLRCITLLGRIRSYSPAIRVGRSYVSTAGSLKPKVEPKPTQIESQAVGGKVSRGQIVLNVVLFCGGLYVISNFIFNTQYKNTSAYKMAMRLLEANYELTSEIGVPITPYYSVTGRRYDGHKLYLEWKIAGPGGDATIVCRNAFVGRKGSIIELKATLADGKVIYIVDEAGSPVPTDVEEVTAVQTQQTNKKE